MTSGLQGCQVLGSNGRVCACVSCQFNHFLLYPRTSPPLPFPLFSSLPVAGSLIAFVFGAWCRCVAAVQGAAAARPRPYPLFSPPLFSPPLPTFPRFPSLTHTRTLSLSLLCLNHVTPTLPNLSESSRLHLFLLIERTHGRGERKGEIESERERVGERHSV